MNDTPPPVPARPTYEYHTHSLDTGLFFSTGRVDAAEITRCLNHYGSQGWELVSTFDANGHDGKTIGVVMIFKRPVMR